MTTEHVMIDLETLSTRPTAAIVSIGACKFSDTKIVSEFYVNVSAKSSKENGLHVSKETVDWWLKQSDSARNALLINPQPLDVALKMFLEWYGSKSLKTWSNGADFDLPIMANALLQCSMEVPWKYWDGMCVRTIQTLTNSKVPRQEGTHHNALDDAVNQAKYIMRFMNNGAGQN